MPRVPRVPRLSVLIPTPGQGRPLARCLTSVAPQLARGDEVLVIGDTHDAPGGLPDVQRTVEQFAREYDKRFVYLTHDAGCHDYGHSQINYGMAQAQGDYLVFNDDDDVFTPGALDAIRNAAAALPEPAPLMFRFVTRFRMVLWAERVIRQDWVGGHMFVPPNIPERLAPWTARYQGDYDHIRGTVDLWPNRDADVVWRDDVVAIARPGAWA